ncbi:MAG: DUF454 family protein [Candidatus Magasanikbacteria bacterium]|nr:DUF454 family protein [Candidatus Magasanikbacteria bacterium]
MKVKVPKWLFVFAGHLAAILAFLGLVLPHVPAALFAFLAAGCYNKGSEKFHKRLLNSRVFGKMIRDWQERRKISWTTRLWIGGSVVFTIAYCVW